MTGGLNRGESASSSSILLRRSTDEAACSLPHPCGGSRRRTARVLRPRREEGHPRSRVHGRSEDRGLGLASGTALELPQAVRLVGVCGRPGRHRGRGRAVCHPLREGRTGRKRGLHGEAALPVVGMARRGGPSGGMDPRLDALPVDAGRLSAPDLPAALDRVDPHRECALL